MLRTVEPSRRNFLVGMGRFAVAAEVAALTPAAALAAETLAGGAACPPPSAWSDLAKQVSGGVLRPGDPFFADVCRPNNLRYDLLPEGIARCVTTKDVQATIAWVKKMGLPFAVRSGGHNYAGYSATKGLLIDMSLMTGIDAVDGSKDLVVVKGGTLNSIVYRELERKGRTITHGRCDAVGAAGFLLGGGIGFNMRRYGIGSDLLRSTELVTADGAVHLADDSTDKNLFWACRGGAGGNFGINTSFTLQTFPVDKVSVCELIWKENLPNVLLTLLTTLPEAPNEFGSKISVTLPSLAQRCQGIGMSISILAQLHSGTNKTLEGIFGDLWKVAEKKFVHKDIPYWEAQDYLSEATFPYYYQEKSSYMQAKGITKASVAAMFAAAAKQPGTAMPVAFKFFQAGGAVNDMKADATAYVHRGYDWLFSVEANWWVPTDSKERIAENLNWQNLFYDIANKSTGAVGAYQNFPDPSLANWSKDYYGANYARLQQVKKAVDPTSFFTYAQGIKPA